MPVVSPVLLCRLAPLFAVLLLSGCDRAPLEQIGPDIEIVSPDLTQALASPGVTVQVRAAARSRVESVRINGIEAERSGDGFSVQLLATEPGVLPIEVVSMGESGAESRLSTAALYLPYAFANPLNRLLEQSVGEHAAARLPDGSVLVTGGVETPGGPATAATFSIGGSFAAEARDSLLAPRAGHTITPLPDGKLLVLGGSVRAFPTELDELVTTAEVYDPVTERFLPVTLALRDPIRRTQHTAVAVALADGGAALYLTGGTGFAGLRGGAPLFGTISTLRRLRYEPDGAGGRLVQDAGDPVDGPRVSFITEHVEAAVAGVPNVRALVGVTDSLAGFLDESLRTVYAEQVRDSRVLLLPGAPNERVRVGHAGAPGLSGLAVFVGGRRPGDPARTPIAATEVYADGPQLRYALPESGGLQQPRWGHSATSLGDGRILVLGGFSTNGQPARLIELFGPR